MYDLLVPVYMLLLVIQTTGQNDLHNETPTRNSMEYLRRFRDVKIGNELLEFVTPLYEQSRFDEKKNCPNPQIIDYAVPSQKELSAPHTLFTLDYHWGKFCGQLLPLA